MKLDFFEYVEIQLFQWDWKLGFFIFELFFGYSNYDLEIVVQSVVCWLSFDYNSYCEIVIFDFYVDIYVWVFDYFLLLDSGEFKWLNFLQWFVSRNKDEERILFWIIGKLGFGKLIMLKFFVQYEDIKKYFEEWVIDYFFEILIYYVWSFGLFLVKLKEGLF